MKTSKKLKPMKANVGKFFATIGVLPKAGKSSKSFFKSIGEFPFVKKAKELKEGVGSKFEKRAKELKEGVDSKFVERAEKLKMGKKMGGSAIKAKGGVEIETSKRKNLKEAAEGARAGGASEATLKYFLDNANMSNKRPTAKTMKYFLDNANKPKDRLTERDFKMINDRFSSRDREEALDEGFSDAEISAMGKKAGGAASKGKSMYVGAAVRQPTETSKEFNYRKNSGAAVSKNRGMGLQDEMLQPGETTVVGKGADYIKDLI